MSGKGKTSPKKIVSKQKEVPKIIAKSKSIESPETPKECALSFPLLKTVDNARTLPRYSAVLGRPDDEGVGMEDLDGLQLELEALLSAVVVRTRVLQEEIRILSDEEDKRAFGRTQAFKRSNPVGRPSLKRARNPEKASKKFREGDKNPAVGSPIKFTKVKTVSLVSNPLNHHVNLLDPDAGETRPEGRKVISPKNDTPNKFWQSVEPFCADITADDIKLLQDLIAEQENVDLYKVPPLGKHYTHRWASEESVDDQPTGSQAKGRRTEASNSSLVAGPLTQRLVSALLEENHVNVEKNADNDGSPARSKRTEAASTGPAANGPLTQRLVSALLEENCAPENDEPKAPVVLRSFSLNFEQALRKKLEEQGLVDPMEDEILEDIKRCQNEIRTVTSYNLQQLKRILKSAEQEMARQELNKKLEAVDAEVCDLYRKIQSNKLKRKPANKKEQEQAWKALRDREQLIQQIDSL